MPGEGLRYHTMRNLPLLGVNYMTQKNMPGYHRKTCKTSQTGGFQSEQKWTKVMIKNGSPKWAGTTQKMPAQTLNMYHIYLLYLRSENVILGIGDRRLRYSGCVCLPMVRLFAVPERPFPLLNIH